MALVADVDGDGMPDVAQNELDAITILSSGTGKVLARLPAPASGSRSFQEIDLGGDIGRVIACGKEAPGFGNPTGGLEVLVIRCAAPTNLLWQWWGPKADWRTPNGSGLCAVGDLDGDGVADLAVPCRDGNVYLLSGKTGEKLKELRFFDHPTEFPPSLYLLGGKGAPSLLFMARKPIASDAPGESAWAHIVGCVRLTDGASLWQKDFGQVKRAFVQDLDGDGVREGLVWKDSTWQVIDGLTGEPRWHGALPQGRHFEPCPLLADVAGTGALALLHIPANPADPMLALRLSDAGVLWQGPSQVRPQQPQGRDGLAFRAPRGELLVTTSRELLALDPQTGRTVWQTDGAPEGLLRGDWDGDGQDNIFATIPGRGLVCLDAAGQTQWALRLNIQVRPDLLVPDPEGDWLPKILIHRHAGLYALVRGPRAHWAQDATGPLQATPLVVYGKGGCTPVIVQLGPWSNEESLRGFDAATGAVCWSARYWLPPNRAPALADWDGDGRCEIVAIGRTLDTNQYKLFVLRAADGTVVHSAPLEDMGATYSTPAVADFDGDGTFDVALHRWDKRDIVAFNGKTGALIWRCPTQLPNMGGVAAADLDGDGHPDVVAPSMDGHIYALRGKDGQPLWPPVSIGRGGSRAPPLLADVNGDGIPEILVVGRDGVLNIINGRTGEMIWKATCNFAGEGLGRPAVGKVGDSTLIVAPLGAAGAVAFDFGTRKKVWQSPLGHPVIAGPVIADIDHDGVPEVIVATADGHVYVLDLATGEPLWHVQVGSEPIEADPTLVSCRGDGLPDILIADHAFRLTAFSSSGLLRNKHLQARAGRP
jgi:outer membrane protein assembly factor BamB